MTTPSAAKHLTLFELNNLVRRTLDSVMDDDYWVETEISELRETRGHCYLELVEKGTDSATPVARASAKCWRQTWGMLKPCFVHATGQMLRPGMKVLLKVYPQFHEAYGFSWIVTNIDPNYTLGDMARKRQEIIRQLREEGVFDLNRSLPLPLFTQRIAVVSSQTAAGFGDFCAQINGNDYGYRFSVELFPAIMQGEGVEQSVVAALDAVNARIDEFDCVVIIRGGGATSDMSGFDTLLLAENVANFPLPVITGIGHDRDECVLDMVSHTRVKTPTAAAAFLIDNLKRVEDRLDDAAARAARCARMRMDGERLRLANAASRLPVLFKMVSTRQNARIDALAAAMVRAVERRLLEARHRIDNAAARMGMALPRRIENERHRQALLGQRLRALDPQLLLARGYSITLYNKRAVRDASQLHAGDEIETKVEKGVIKSIVK